MSARTNPIIPMQTFEHYFVMGEDLFLEDGARLVVSTEFTHDGASQESVNAFFVNGFVGPSMMIFFVLVLGADLAAAAVAAAVGL